MTRLSTPTVCIYTSLPQIVYLNPIERGEGGGEEVLIESSNFLEKSVCVGRERCF